MIIDNDLLSIQEARILAENACAAQKQLSAFSQEQLDKIVEAMAEAVYQYAEPLAVISRDETDYGKQEDKAAKNRFVCGEVRKYLKGMRCVGVIGQDKARCTMDIGVPLGVIAALCPVTSPVSTTICKTLIAIKSGNAIIFSPHPGAGKAIRAALDIMIESAHAGGLPRGCLSYMSTVTKGGTAELINHRAIALIMLSGVPGMRQAAHCSGKPVIYSGTGSGPAFIERTANIRQAVQDIIQSKTFDHGIAPCAEQSIVVDSCIEQEVRLTLQDSGGYFMSGQESHKLAELLFCADGRHRAGMVGVPAAVLARRAGINAPENVKLLIAERKYICEDDPYSRELLAPVVGYYVEDDWMDACEKCIELLLHEGSAHTLVIHSKDEEVILQFALKKPVGRLLVNTPAAFGGVGATTSLVPSVLLGSGSAGHGITADNVSPLNLIYVRKVGYGVKQADCTAHAVPQGRSSFSQGIVFQDDSNVDKKQALQQILAEVVRVIDNSAGR